MGFGTLVKSVKIERTLKKAKKLCKTKRDFDYFIKGLKDERDFRELMKNTASNYWSGRKMTFPPLQKQEAQNQNEHQET